MQYFRPLYGNHHTLAPWFHGNRSPLSLPRVICSCPADPQDPDAISGVVLTQDNVDVVVQVNTTVLAEVQIDLPGGCLLRFVGVLSFTLLFRCEIDDGGSPVATW